MGTTSGLIFLAIGAVSGRLAGTTRAFQVMVVNVTEGLTPCPRSPDTPDASWPASLTFMKS
jgi:hypothetical protein